MFRIVVAVCLSDSLFQSRNFQNLTGWLVATFSGCAEDGDVGVSVSIEGDTRWLVERQELLRGSFLRFFLAKRN